MSVPDSADYGQPPVDPYVEGGWMCDCGYYEQSQLHCERCGREPPWGCDCGYCLDVGPNYEAGEGE